jgi:protein ImuB
MFGALYAAEGSSPDALIAVAREFSPRLESSGPRLAVLDLSGLARLFGDARAIGEALRRTAADHGLRVRVAIAGTRTAARLLVHHRAGLTVIEPGTEAATLAPLPIELLAVLADADAVSSHLHTLAPSHLGTHPRTLAPSDAPSHPRSTAPSHPDALSTFRRWGLRTLGAIASLPADAVAARLGQAGVRWQRAARGEDPRPLIPACPEERFEQALDLEWPIEGLEPLSFVLGRLMEPLSAHLERRGRGVAVLRVRLHLVTRDVHERALELPAPMRDARALRTLALLDLESHPPPAAIDRVVVAADPTPGRVLQFSLLTRPLPTPEQLSTLMARLTALMGEGRCGSPAAVDTWQPGAFAMRPVTGIGDQGSGIRERGPGTGRTKHLPIPDPQSPIPDPRSPSVALRRFRVPVPARVRVEQGAPVRVLADRRVLSGGRVDACAGPWRTSGGWWGDGAGDWDRDEWDVALSDGATYRIYRQRARDAWFIEGVFD